MGWDCKAMTAKLACLCSVCKCTMLIAFLVGVNRSRSSSAHLRVAGSQHWRGERLTGRQVGGAGGAGHRRRADPLPAVGVAECCGQCGNCRVRGCAKPAAGPLGRRHHAAQAGAPAAAGAAAFPCRLGPAHAQHVPLSGFRYVCCASACVGKRSPECLRRSAFQAAPRRANRCGRAAQTARNEPLPRWVR